MQYFTFMPSLKAFDLLVYLRGNKTAGVTARPLGVSRALSPSGLKGVLSTLCA